MIGCVDDVHIYVESSEGPKVDELLVTFLSVHHSHNVLHCVTITTRYKTCTEHTFANFALR